MCGIAGVWGVENPVNTLLRIMKALHYRGGQGSGVAFIRDDGAHFYERAPGEFPELANAIDLGKLKNQHFVAGVGHLRYGTTGIRHSHANIQPFYGRTKRCDIYLAHNGETPFFSEEREKLLDGGAAFVSDSDSELFLHYFGRSSYIDPVDSIRYCLESYPGTYSVVVLVQDGPRVKLVLARDPSGNRPLFLGKLDDGYVAVSEDSALQAVGGELSREISPGEMLVVGPDVVKHSIKPIRVQNKLPQHCVFENIYFSFPHSRIFGLPVGEFRKRLGRRAAMRWGHLVGSEETVSNVPDSANYFTIGFCSELARPLGTAFVRRHMTRTFTKESDNLRDEAVRDKFSVDTYEVAGKRIWLLDDSIVRGITLRRLIRVLRSAGAAWVGVIVSCPPIIGPCGKGMDFKEDGLIARKFLSGRNEASIEEIRKHIEADALYYNTREDVFDVIKSLGGNPDHFCFGCFDNKEPIWGAW